MKKQNTSLLYIKQCSVRTRENILFCAESIPQCLCRPVPLPAEKAYGHGVDGHICALSKQKKISSFIVDERVLDQSRPMETNIIPENNKPGQL